MEKQKKNYSKREVSDFTEGKHRFQKFGRWFVPKFILPFFYKIEYEGLENIPKDKNYIVAPNHISYFDPFLTGAATLRPISYMGKKELFENPVLAFFAVNREKLEVSTIKTALNIFKTKIWLLGIFPQGGIRRNRKIENVNRGFAVIAKQMKTDILPIGITGSEEYNWNPFHKGKIKVCVGELVSYNQEYDAIIDEWGSKIAKMIDYEYVKETAEEPAKV